MHWNESELGMVGSIIGHCSVDKCTNGYRGLQKWLSLDCGIHKGYKHNVGYCVCEPPYTLWTFPVSATKADLRKRWIKLINKQNWTPTTYVLIIDK